MCARNTPVFQWRRNAASAQRKVTLDELASHVERYREEHAT